MVLGRDSRVSGPLFHQVARAALESVGADVIDLGLTTTPTLQMAVEHHHAAGGLCITASHNPVEWNALKCVGPAGLFLNAAEGAAMRALVEGGIPYATLGPARHDALRRRRDRAPPAGGAALPFINVGAIRARGFRVAYDACRGAGGAIIPHLLELLGCEVHAINLETDGRFPRPPEPVPENLGDLERLVKDTGAQIGFATDPDVDRLAVVSERGRGDRRGLHARLRVPCRAATPEGTVVTNLSTSRVLDDAAAEHGQRVIRAPVGEVNVALRIRAENAVIGGEGNGGVILPELHLGRDAPLGVALVLQLLLEDPRTVSQIVAGSPRYAIIKDKLARPDAPLDAVYAALAGGVSRTPRRTRRTGCGWAGTIVGCTYGPRARSPWCGSSPRRPRAREAQQLVERGRELLADASQ